MTDDRRDAIRRSEDQVIATAIEELRGMRESDVERLATLEAVFYDTMLGEKDAFGRRKTEEGMKHRVDFMYEKFANGGVRIQIPAGMWVFLAAVATGLFGVLAALIAGAGPAGG